MDKKVQGVLRAFEKRAEKESVRMRELSWADMANHVDEFLLSVGPATGELINLLAKEAESKVILEVGSSYGYSTVWLAEAARETGGKVISLEIHEEKQKHARASVEKAGLGGIVDFRLGDARASLEKLKGSVDFVLLDLWKNFYIPCFDLFYPKLKPGALIVADNMTYPEESRPHAEKYQKHIRKKGGIQSVLLNVGSGLELTRYR
ncbi:MAG TPA: class I SAM-dependent methyltransferase [Terriglobia bacterium]|nr:class I SAM-dependent methyltransferase [Terriglobia bacterium]